MKIRNETFFSFIFAFICISTFGQTTKGTLYKTDHWSDIKGKGDWAIAMDNPTYEKVEILQTDNYIKVTFGIKVYNYKIISFSKYSDFMMNYNVSLNNKTYVMSISIDDDGTNTINIDNEFMVADIKDVSKIDNK